MTRLNDRREAILYGAAVRGLRCTRGWSQEQTARAAGITVGRLSSIERGDHVRAFPNAIKDIARAFNIETRRIPGVVDGLRAEIRTLGGADLLDAATRHWSGLKSDLDERRYCLVDTAEPNCAPRFRCSNPIPLEAGSWALTLTLHTQDPGAFDVFWIARDASEVLVSARVIGANHHIWATNVTAEASVEETTQRIEAVFIR